MGPANEKSEESINNNSNAPVNLNQLLSSVANNTSQNNDNPLENLLNAVANSNNQNKERQQNASQNLPISENQNSPSANAVMALLGSPKASTPRNEINNLPVLSQNNNNNNKANNNGPLTPKNHNCSGHSHNHNHTNHNQNQNTPNE